MKRIFYIIIISQILHFSACTTTSKTSTKKDDIIDITILHINDVYEIAPLEGGKTGGMARVATLKKKLLAENPNTFLLHAGDFLSPSVIGSLKHEGKRIRGKQMVDAMNVAGVDIATFGNHEFDLDEADLLARLQESRFGWVSSNVSHKKADGSETPFRHQPNGTEVDIPKKITLNLTDRDGTKAKVGIFGITIPSNPKPYVAYSDFAQAAKEMAKQLANEQHDITLAITHIDELDDVALAKVLPEVKLFMGGHDHTNMYYTVNNNYVAKADANAKTAYVHRLRYDAKKKTTSVRSELVKIDNTILEDAETKAVVEKWLGIVNAEMSKMGMNINETLAHLTEPLDGLESSNRHKQTNMGRLITDAMLFAAPKSEAVFVNSGSIRIDDKVVGTITPYDVFRILPFGGSIVEVEMKGELLRRVLAASRQNKGKGGYFQVKNIIDNEGSISINGEPLNDARTYRMATSDFMLTGLEANFAFFKEDLLKDQIKVFRANANDSKDYRKDVRQAVVEFLKAK